MSKEAFIFDMDGVVVDSERAWFEHENNLLIKTFGKSIADQIGDTTGISVRSVYEMATNLGFQMPRDEFQKLYDVVALAIYDKAAITPDVETLADFLLSRNFSLGMVSSSPLAWINKVVPRLSFGNQLSSIISLNDRSDLQPKPAPDGYLMSMKNLGSDIGNSIILEDSNPGIMSAKASGAFTIGYRGNLVPRYNQKGADIYANNMLEVVDIVKNLGNLRK